MFPLPGGLLESAGLDRGMLDPDVLVVSGHDETVEVLDSLGEADTGQTLLVEALMCRGCYCGPGISSSEPGLLRKRRVGEYVAECRRREAEAAALRPAGEAEDERPRRRLPRPRPRAAPTPPTTSGCPSRRRSEIREILARTNKFFPEDELNCGACGYPTCRAKAVAVHSGMAEDAMCLPFMIDQAERVCVELNVPWSEMRDVHRHIINTEKLASMGQMAAGVAHELNNPLSTILLYTHILGQEAQGPRRPGPRPQARRRGERALQEDRRQPARLRAAEPRARGERRRARRGAAGGGLRRRDGAAQPATTSTSWSTWRPACAPTSTATR